MLSRITLLFSALILGFTVATGQQEVWTLEKCIQYARQNSLSIKQAQYNIKSAELLQKQATLSRLPSLNANGNAGYQFGRTIDPTTNGFKNENIGFNSYSLNAGVILYSGGEINNNIKQSRINLETAQLDAVNTANNIGLNVANAYLNILLAQEQLDNSRTRREQTQHQLEQTDKLIQAGSLPENDRLDILAQLALDEQSIIDAQNLVSISYLSLKQLMEIDPNTNFQIDRPEIGIPTDATPEGLTLEQVYNAALGAQPQIKASELRIQSADIGVQLAKAGALPTLSLSGNLSTSYSTRGQRITGYETQLIPQTVYVNGSPLNFEYETEIPQVADNPFTKQIKENFGQSVGLNLSIPLYNNGRNSVATERARLSVLNAEVSDRQVRQQLKTDVQTAIANAIASKQSYEASQRSLNAAQVAYDNAQKRFNLGAINTLLLTTASNNLEQAKVNLTRAKYQYIFNLKVVDFYLGKDIKLN